MERDKLNNEITQLRSRLDILEKEEAAYRQTEEDIIDKRIEKAYTGNGDFTLNELRFAAVTRCKCGAGMAYPKKIGFHGAWHCSAILLGNAEKKPIHDGAMPFMFWEIRSEDQSDDETRTTRPV